MLKTHLINYNFNLNTPADNAAWRELKESLKTDTKEYGHKRCLFEASSLRGQSYCYAFGATDKKEVWLETNFLYDNQWNTAEDSPNYPGARVFDWALDATSGSPMERFGWWLPKNVKRGHYLVITDEMKKIRDETFVCGYCGYHYPKHDLEAQEFCSHCLGSEYLKKDDLHLLRLRPVSAGHQYRSPELTQDELACLLPAYVAAQVENSRKALDKELAAVLAKADQVFIDTFTERDGMLWLLNHEIGVKNVIFYPRTGRFCLGWLNQVDQATVSTWRIELAGFPYPMDIKTTTGTVPLTEKEEA